MTYTITRQETMLGKSVQISNGQQTLEQITLGKGVYAKINSSNDHKVVLLKQRMKMNESDYALFKGVTDRVFGTSMNGDTLPNEKIDYVKYFTKSGVEKHCGGVRVQLNKDSAPLSWGMEDYFQEKARVGGLSSYGAALVAVPVAITMSPAIAPVLGLIGVADLAASLSFASVTDCWVEPIYHVGKFPAYCYFRRKRHDPNYFVKKLEHCVAELEKKKDSLRSSRAALVSDDADRYFGFLQQLFHDSPQQFSVRSHAKSREEAFALLEDWTRDVPGIKRPVIPQPSNVDSVVEPVASPVEPVEEHKYVSEDNWEK